MLRLYRLDVHIFCCTVHSFLLHFCHLISLHVESLSVDNIRLTWDLFVLVFFVIVIAYSFIIGRNTTLKVIISSYMAILVADGLGDLLNTYVVPAAPTLEGESGDQFIILSKIITYVIIIVLLVIKGGFRVDILPERTLITRILANLSFGFLNAGLLICTLLVYLTGGSFVFGLGTAAVQSNLYQESTFIQLMVDNYSIWFALPAIAIVVASFFEPRETAV